MKHYTVTILIAGRRHTYAAIAASWYEAWNAAKWNNDLASEASGLIKFDPATKKSVNRYDTPEEYRANIRPAAHAVAAPAVRQALAMRGETDS